jgi:hypothetical protein
MSNDHAIWNIVVKQKRIPGSVQYNRINDVIWVLAPCSFADSALVSEKHTVSIFRAKVKMMGSGGVV